MFRFIVLEPPLRAIYPSLTGQFIMLTLTSVDLFCGISLQG